MRFCIISVFAALFAGVVAAPASAGESLGAAVIRGSTIYDAAALFEIYKPHLGKPVDESTGTVIAESVRERYRQDGYSRPGVDIVDDGIRSGIVRITLREASVSGVRINGSSGPHDERLQRLFDDVPDDSVMRPGDIREIVRQARRLPGLEVTLAARPDDTAASGYLLEVDSDFRRYSGSLTLTNRGTEQIGRYLALGSISMNGPLGGVLGLRFASARNNRDYSSVGVFGRVPLADTDDDVLFSLSRASLAIESSGILVEQDRRWNEVSIQKALPNWQHRRLSLQVGILTEDLHVEHDGVFARDEDIDGVEAALSMSWAEGRQQHSLRAELELGIVEIDVAGLPTHGYDFLIGRLQYVGLRSLTDALWLRWEGYGQHASERLPSIRQFKVGGGRIGRGFDAAALRGETGLGGKVELRRRLADNLPVAGRLDTYGFYDIGAVWPEALPGRTSAATAGLGISFQSGMLAGYVEVAKPLTQPDADGLREAGVFAEITGRF